VSVAIAGEAPGIHGIVLYRARTTYRMTAINIDEYITKFSKQYNTQYIIQAYNI